MSQLDSGTFQQVKDLVLSGYHRMIFMVWLARPHCCQMVLALKALSAFLWSVSASVVQ